MSSTLLERKIRTCLLWHNRSAVNQPKNLRDKMLNLVVSVVLHSRCNDWQ